MSKEGIDSLDIERLKETPASVVSLPMLQLSRSNSFGGLNKMLQDRGLDADMAC